MIQFSIFQTTLWAVFVPSLEFHLAKLRSPLRQTELWLPSERHISATVTLKYGSITQIHHHLKSQKKVRLSHSFRVFVMPSNVSHIDSPVMISVTFPNLSCRHAVELAQLWAHRRPLAHFYMDDAQSPRVMPMRQKREAVPLNKNQLIERCSDVWDQNMLNSHFSAERTSNPLTMAQNILPCCQRHLTVNFTLIGWSSWIIEPEAFETSYCIGRCSFFSGLYG